MFNPILLGCNDNQVVQAPQRCATLYTRLLINFKFGGMVAPQRCATKTHLYIYGGPPKVRNHFKLMFNTAFT